MVPAFDGACCRRLMDEVRGGLGNVGAEQQDFFIKPSKFRDRRLGRGVE